MKHEGIIPEDAWSVLSPLLTEGRSSKMQQVASQRTRYVRLVLQDVQNAHNVSACLRSAEAFGIAEVDVINPSTAFKASTVARGVAPWLTINVHESIASCARALKQQGYFLATGMPAQDAKPVGELSLERPIAVIFGNEHAGVSPEWFDYIDLRFTIPMVGFVESLNISVCAAITTQLLTSRARKEVPAAQYFLTSGQTTQLLNRWAWQQRTSPQLEYNALARR